MSLLYRQKSRSALSNSRWDVTSRTNDEVFRWFTAHSQIPKPGFFFNVIREVARFWDSTPQQTCELINLKCGANFTSVRTSTRSGFVSQATCQTHSIVEENILKSNIAGGIWRTISSGPNERPPPAERSIVSNNCTSGRCSANFKQLNLSWYP